MVSQVGDLRRDDVFPDEYLLVTYLEDVEWFMQQYAIPSPYSEGPPGSLLVRPVKDKLGDTVDYDEVWATWSSFPKVWDTFERIY